MIPGGKTSGSLGHLSSTNHAVSVALFETMVTRLLSTNGYKGGYGEAYRGGNVGGFIMDVS